MLSNILIVVAVALISYVLLPLAGKALLMQSWKRLIARLGTEPRIPGYCTGYLNGALLIKLTGTKQDSDISIRPRHTVFLILRSNDEPERISWRTLSLVQSGTTVYVIKSTKPLKPNLCVFHDEKNAVLFAKRISNLALPKFIANPLKPYFIATGAFVEFMLFLQYIQLPDMGIASIAALVAIFGKALPYCPPGLVCTLFAHLIKKKRRQHTAVGVLLLTGGILLNIAVIFLIIRNISF